MDSTWQCCNTVNCCVVRCFRRSNIQDAILHHLHPVLIEKDVSVLSMTVKEEESISEVPQSYSTETSVGVVNHTSANVFFPALFGCDVFRSSNHDEQHLYFCDEKIFHSDVKKVLDFMNLREIGFASPYFYVMDSHATLLWEVHESTNVDMNGLPHSSCKLWFLMPIKHIELFEQIMSQILRVRSSRSMCLNLLGHINPSQKVLQGINNGIECSSILEDNSMSSILFPPFGFDGVDQHSELKKLVRGIRIQTGNDDIQTIKTEDNSYDCMSSVEHSCDPMVFPQINVEEINVKCEVQESDVEETAYRVAKDDVVGVPTESASRHKQTSFTSFTSLRSSRNAAQREVCTCVGQQLLRCLSCPFIVKAGENRVQRLLCHVKKCHQGCVASLIKKTKLAYPIKPCPSKPQNYFLDRRLKLASFCSLNNRGY